GYIARDKPGDLDPVANPAGSHQGGWTHGALPKWSATHFRAAGATTKNDPSLSDSRQSGSQRPGAAGSGDVHGRVGLFDLGSPEYDHPQAIAGSSSRRHAIRELQSRRHFEPALRLTSHLPLSTHPSEPGELSMIKLIRPWLILALLELPCLPVSAQQPAA